MDPGYFRAHAVRCLAHVYLSNFTQAVEDHETAVVLAEGNLVLLERLEELRVALEMMRSSAVYGAARGSAVTSSEWIGDFGLLGFDVLTSTPVSGAPESTGVDVVAEGGDAKRRKEEAHHGLPKLIPVGEWMGPDVCEQLLDHTSYKLVEKALKEKQKGNAEFASGNLGRALQLYTRAIKLNPDDALFYSNRALVYIRLQRYEEAVSDCSASIARQPSIKAFARRAAALDALRQHVDASRDHRQSLAFEPRNPSCLAAFRACLEALLVQQPSVSEKDRIMAERDLKDIVNFGRISDESLGTAQLLPPPDAISSSTIPDASGDKKKRTAGE